MPAGAALPAGSAVAAGIAVGKAALLPFDGTAVGAGPLLVDGAAVALALGTAVGEVEPLLASDILPSPNLRFVVMFPKLQISSPEEIS